mgnify:CR=1 FL=1
MGGSRPARAGPRGPARPPEDRDRPRRRRGRIAVERAGLGAAPQGAGAFRERLGRVGRLVATREQLGLVGTGIRVDDFILAPPDADEFQVRMSRALWLRTGADEGNVLRRGGLAIDLERYTVSVDGETVDLTYKEYELLRFLATNAGKPFTREALLNRVWGYDYYGGSRTVDVHIRRLRRKLGSFGDTYIQTVFGVGYRFERFRAPRPLLTYSMSYAATA